MLSKLIKYDIRSTWRDFAGVYLSILLGALILPALFNVFNNPLVYAAGGLIVTAIVISTVVVTIVTLFKIFNANVFSKSGYLTMTLPVTATEIVASKLLVSTMWVVLTGIVAAVAAAILAMTQGAVHLADLAEAIRQMTALFESRGVLAILLVLVTMIASVVKEIAKLFLACSIAHLKQIGRFRVLAGILSYFILSWMEVLVVRVVGLIAHSIPGVEEYVRQITVISDTNGFQQFIGVFSGAMAIAILYALALTVVYSIGTIWILNHKLDLD